MSVILPKQFEAYANSLNSKSKTDRIDARILAQMGLERSLANWQPASPVMRQLKQLCRKKNTLKDEKKTLNVCTIKGIGLMTALALVAETNGFALFTNKAQLVCYAGYDVVKNESGSSVKGLTKISKRGNSHIRKALHFPALSTIRYEPKFQQMSARITQQTSLKMKGIVAVQRKLLF